MTNQIQAIIKADELQRETREAMAIIKPGTVADASNRLGIVEREPLLYCMDGLLRYAKAHANRYGSQLAQDYVLGDHWIAAAKGIRGLLNGDGAVALERNISTDSKDNRVIETVFWKALDIAGYTEADL